jgi:hypothetical protein
MYAVRDTWDTCWRLAGLGRSGFNCLNREVEMMMDLSDSKRIRATIARFMLCYVGLICLPLSAQTNSISAYADAIRGAPIRAALPPSTNTSLSATAQVLVLNRPDQMEGEFIRLGFDKLSAFDYEVYEVYSETNAGRPFLRSTNTIPPQIKVYDGKRVMLTGFVLPLRLKRGQVVEFLLLRDQGTCCFGQAAKLNHFIRVRMKGNGFPLGQPVPYRVTGRLSVGEIFVAGYLTGIYWLDAERAAPDHEF